MCNWMMSTGWLLLNLTSLFNFYQRTIKFCLIIRDIAGSLIVFSVFVVVGVGL